MSLLTLFSPTRKKGPLDPSPLPSEPDDLQLSEEYGRVATKLGVAVTNSGLVSPVAQAIRSAMLPVYNLAAVEEYLDRKGHWSWYPLRARDRKFATRLQFNLRTTPTAYSILYGDTADAVYTAPVPLPVLLTVESLVSICGEDLVCFVAAPKLHPDPFLGVLSASERHTLFVVERWNEPGFRDR